MVLDFEVYAKVARPVEEVFDAVYDHRKLSRYFTTGGASGPLVAGTSPMWDFHDFPGAFPVHVRKVEPNQSIDLEWQAADGKYLTQVRFTFASIEGGTLVRIRESGWRVTAEGRKASYGNCMGWSQMLCALKVWLEHGHNLREFMY